MEKSTSKIDALRAAILRFAEAHPDSICRFDRRQRVIRQGEVSTHCYLLTEGAVTILVREPDTNIEKPVAVRTEGDLIGETALLQRQGLRNANVDAVSPTTAIRLSRHDVFELVRRDPSLRDAVTLVWELAAARQEETLGVMDGQIKIENRVGSVLIADIHNFTSLGESAWEEQSNSFLFDFLEESELIQKERDDSYEDHGDGCKMIFVGGEHAQRALESAQTIAQIFLGLRSQWTMRSNAFANIGLGIGICTDCLSIRTRLTPHQSRSRVLSHSLSIAAAISSHRMVPSDVTIYTDADTRAMATSEFYKFEQPENVWLGKTGRIYPLFKVALKQDSERGTITESSTAATVKDSKERLIAGDKKISILFLASEPSDDVRLRLAEEAREIEKNIRIAKLRDDFVFNQKGAVRTQDLSQALLDFEPEIVHFSGHGSQSGFLSLEDKTGATHPVPPRVLAALFREFSSVVRCVILNACYSEDQATAIAQHVDYVIGMDKTISDDAAIAFSVGLYQAIGAGKSLEEAYRLGCVQVDLATYGQEGSIPVLKKKQKN